MYNKSISVGKGGSLPLATYPSDFYFLDTRGKPTLQFVVLQVLYVEDITRWREDVNFMFGKQLYCSCQENFELTRNVLFLIQTDWWPRFDDFPEIFDHFPKIFKDFSKGHTNVAQHFYKTFPNTTEDCQRLSRTFRSYINEFKYNLRDKLDVSEMFDVITSEDMEKGHPSPGCGLVWILRVVYFQQNSRGYIVITSFWPS